LQELIMIILLPLYFTYLGLKTDLSTIDSYQAAVSIVLIIAASMVGKIGGAAVASRILRNTWRYLGLCRCW
jgi:Kef-type K+ transport system membrane component KefB